jgi:hypothetical protein
VLTGGESPCTDANGGCSHLCLFKGGDEFVCACPTPKYNNRSCECKDGFQFDPSGQVCEGQSLCHFTYGEWQHQFETCLCWVDSQCNNCLFQILMNVRLPTATNVWTWMGVSSVCVMKALSSLPIELLRLPCHFIALFDFYPPQTLTNANASCTMKAATFVTTWKEVMNAAVTRAINWTPRPTSHA